MIFIYILAGFALIVFLMQIGMVLQSKRRKGKPVPELDKRYAQALQEQEKVILYFFSARCRACAQMTPYMKELEQNRNDVFVIDASADTETARKLGIMGTPSTLLIRNGTVSEFMLGYRSREAVLKMLDN